MAVIPTDCRLGGFSISSLLWINLNSKCSALNSPPSAISVIPTVYVIQGANSKPMPWHDLDT